MITLNINGHTKKYLLDQNSNGIKLSNIAKDFEKNYLGYISLAIVNNELKELSSYINKDSDIKFLDTKTPDGRRVYARTLNLVFIMACKYLYPNSRVIIEHSLGKGVYCEIHLNRDIEDEDILKIKSKMDEIIAKDYNIDKTVYTKEEAIKIFNSIGLYEKAELIKYKEEDSVKIYKCNDYIDHFYGYLMPSTGYVKTYDILKYQNGIILMANSEEDKTIPKKFIPQHKLAKIYEEAENWSDLLGVDKVLSLNKIIEDKKYGDIIRIVEALHEKKIGQIADIIKQENKRIILIAAPSSSGKTSFATRLCIHLKVNHLNPVSISLDDYFVNRNETPLDEFGKLDYESIYAINLERFNRDLSDLLNGKEVQLPKYNFITGKSEEGKILKIEENQPIILEGIHGLNPLLTASIPNDKKFKIYLSVLTQINLDDHNRIPTTDLRLIRRIVRDNQFRGHNAEVTINGWASVRRGEEKNIFPYQEEADVIFNTACVYELALLKAYVKPLLEEIDKNNEAYIEAKRLLKFLQYFVELEDISDISPTAIIKEFIGGSKIVD